MEAGKEVPGEGAIIPAAQASVAAPGHGRNNLRPNTSEAVTDALQ